MDDKIFLYFGLYLFTKTKTKQKMIAARKKKIVVKGSCRQLGDLKKEKKTNEKGNNFVGEGRNPVSRRIVFT